MSPNEKYPAVAKFLVESTVPKPKSGRVFASLTKLKMVGNQQIYQSKKGNFYAWDFTHGHWEVYTRRGKAVRVESNSGKIVRKFAPADNRKKLKL